jgi:hypothetical protein
LRRPFATGLRSGFGTLVISTLDRFVTSVFDLPISESMEQTMDDDLTTPRNALPSQAEFAVRVDARRPDANKRRRISPAPKTWPV